MKSLPPVDSATRVLVVDTESPLRQTLENLLAAEGFHVLTATNRHQASLLARTHSIDLVLLNMLMPHAEGIGSIIAIRSVRPGARITAMSGSPADAASHFLPLAKSLGAAAIIHDPQNHAQLIQTLRSLARPESQQVA